jgi:uncharacterized phiE125 gp8 family phage protein
MGLKLITAPSVEPVTLAQAKAHLRVTHTQDDAYILDLIVAARLRAEKHTGRRFCTQTVDYFIDAFPSGAIELPCPPVASITSLKYIDENGAEQTLSGVYYKLSAGDEPARVTAAYDQTWPTTRAEADAVVIRLVCGYGGMAAVPRDIAMAILMIVAHLYEHREEVSDFQVFQVPQSADSLLNFHRVLRF